VCRNLRDPWVAEIKALFGVVEPDALAVAVYEKRGPAFACLGERDIPVVIAGVEIVREGLGQSWMLGTDGWQRHATEIARATRRVVRALLTDGGLRRVQMISPLTDEKARRWIRALGFSPEGTLRRYCLDGGDALIYGATLEG